MADASSLTSQLELCERALIDCDAARELADLALRDDAVRQLKEAVQRLHILIFGSGTAPPRTSASLGFPDQQPDEGWRLQRPAWRFTALDREHPRPWGSNGDDILRSLLAELSKFESMTWEEIEQMPHSHSWPSIVDWEVSSLNRLEELRLDDRTGWYQLQVNNLGRLFGFRSGNVFHVVWWDRFHEVYRPRQQ